jgi:ElaB/YqjD/DUF883 family membrane-anchored ribosome-binding protein
MDTETGRNTDVRTEVGKGLSNDVQILKEDVRQVGEDLRKVGGDLNQAVRHVGDRAAVTATESFEELKLAANNAYESLREEIVAYVEQKPVTSVVGAFFCGLIFGRIFRRS